MPEIIREVTELDKKIDEKGGRLSELLRFNSLSILLALAMVLGGVSVVNANTPKAHSQPTTHDTKTVPEALEVLIIDGSKIQIPEFKDATLSLENLEKAIIPSSLEAFKEFLKEVGNNSVTLSGTFRLMTYENGEYGLTIPYLEMPTTKDSQTLTRGKEIPNEKYFKLKLAGDAFNKTDLGDGKIIRRESRSEDDFRQVIDFLKGKMALKDLVLLDKTDVIALVEDYTKDPAIYEIVFYNKDNKEFLRVSLSKSFSENFKIPGDGNTLQVLMPGGENLQIIAVNGEPDELVVLKLRAQRNPGTRRQK